MRKLFSTRTTDTGLTIGTLLLRLGAGGLMMAHGFDKLVHFSENAARFPDPLHVGHVTSLALVVFAEFFCAAFVVAGLFTRLACVPLIITMAVACFVAHKGQVFGDGESSALYLCCYLALLFLGPGKASLDRFIGK